MLSKVTDPWSARRMFQVLPWLILAGGLALTWLLGSQLRQREIAIERAEFALRVNEVVSGLQHRMTANAQILRGVAGLFESTGEVSREGFRRYVEGLRLDRYYPGIQGVGYAAVVPAADQALHVAQMRAQGLPDYAIRPPGDRDPYSAVIYVEPFDWRNQRAIGFDLLTEPVRAAAAARARDQDGAAMSDRVTLKQEADGEVPAGVLLFVPVYHNGLPLDTVAQRRSALRGWAYAALRIQDAVDAFLLSDYRELSKRLSLQIFSTESQTPETLLYNLNPEPDAALDHLEIVRPVTIAGSDWIFRVAPRVAHPAGWRAHAVSLIVMVTGALLSIALALFLYTLTRSHLRLAAALDEAGRANRALADRTGELADSEGRVRAKLAALLDPAGDLETLNLADIVDCHAIQQIMDEFFRLTQIGVAVIDLRGQVLVSTGWQTICTRFHRVHPVTAGNCVESDTLLSRGVAPGAYRTYRCKNGMWEMVTPIMVGTKHIGNLFLGQFLFDDEPLDLEGFRAQARRYGFDEAAYLAAYTQVPRWSRVKVDTVMRFYGRFAELISRLSHANIQLARTLTEQQRGEQALFVAKEQAEAANRAKSMFLANMSHEIRTPLNAILGFAQVLVRDPGLNAMQRDGLVTIQRSGEHLLTLINDILDLAKIEAGRMTQQAAPFELPGLIADIEAFFRQHVRDRGLELTIETRGLHRMVVGDKLRLRQVLINLVGNAVKFTSAGQVTLRVECASGDEVRFSVLDTGTGIAAEDLTRVFKPFTQTAAGRKLQEGTGLGLALSSQFVRLMGGDLAVDSRPDRGSCFTFTIALPSATTAEPDEARGELPVVGLASGQPVCRVLIVDDQQDNRQPLRALLETLNPQPPVLEIREATDGQAALAVWETWQPQVIFMDMRMPILSGEAATRQLKARMRARPDAVRSVIVALSASAFDENRDQFLASGCDAFACKPFRAEDLFAILERCAGLRFIRGAAPSVPDRGLSPQALAVHLAACPPGWRADLGAAVALGDFDRITTLLETLKDQQHALYAMLTAWAYNYDLDAFVTLLNAGESVGGDAGQPVP
jgi:signal transduction histidine kinase/CHASE1-domain containing sensor protein/DNA-binding response OmpR family regulator